jgi:beta-glucan synthesis-associated protein KRE6
MGNLGRAGYGATVDGMWPYSYDSCDVGTLPNQTFPDHTPIDSFEGGYEGNPLSFLPGQRLSACTCDGEIHPGPKRTDGSFVGRAAPEIDVLEAIVNDITGLAENSQSSQWAPFNKLYDWDNDTYSVMHQEGFHLNS